MSADLDAKVIEFVRQVTSAMGLALETQVEETPDNIRINLSGDGADVLLRRKGEPLDALQVIVNTAFGRDARGDRHYIVDALGFRRDKDAELRQMALGLMDKVRETGRLQELGARSFRVEFVNEQPAEVTRTLVKYGQLLRGEISGAELWRELKLLHQLGVTRGQMETAPQVIQRKQ